MTIAKPEHEVTYQELVALVQRQADKHGLSALEVLAVAANMVGKLVAMQDQRSITPTRAMQVVNNNLQLGNQQVIDELATTTKGIG